MLTSPLTFGDASMLEFVLGGDAAGDSGRGGCVGSDGSETRFTEIRRESQTPCEESNSHPLKYSREKSKQTKYPNDIFTVD